MCDIDEEMLCKCGNPGWRRLEGGPMRCCNGYSSLDHISDSSYLNGE